MRNVYLGIDLGSRCGVAALYERDGVILGLRVWELSYPTEKVEPLRYKKFAMALREILLGLSETPENRLCGVFYEDVYRHIGTKAAHAYGAYRMLMLITCHELGIKNVVPLGVKVIKKHATDNGNARKEDMIARAQEVYGGIADLRRLTDNQADAIWIADLGMINGQ